jgi:hypothetical protein
MNNQTDMTEAANNSSPARHREDVNNHIHTHYSFSPYSPSAAVERAKGAGLSTAGIMDHDSLAGADEFEKAGREIGMPTTVGMEVRADFANTPLNGRRINNPDQVSIAYVALHGIPKISRPMLRDFMKPFMEARVVRNRIMTLRIHDMVQPYGFSLDYDRDVIPLSHWAQGGSVTERHLLFALALKMLARFGSSSDLAAFLKGNLNIPLTAKAEGQLTDAKNPHVAYDLLGVLKSALVQSFYVDAGAECPDIRDLVKMAGDAGAICAYAYLGDVTDSVTGDKKSQAFEDGYLDLLFDTLSALKFNAVTYMPSRNTPEQLLRLRALCDMHGLFQISGEDINSPRQSFVCEAMRAPGFENLADAAWALIGHEAASAERLSQGMFSKETAASMPNLCQRTAYFAALGRAAREPVKSLRKEG